MAILTKPVNALKSTLKADKAVNEARLASKAGAGMSKNHKAYLKQWGPKPRISEPGIMSAVEDTAQASAQEAKNVSNSWVSRVLRNEF